MFGWAAREKPAAEPVVSRRREALLRQGEAARQERLTAEDVARLQGESSGEARQALAAKFGRLFDELCHGPQRELSDAVLRLLARDLAKEVRQALAEAVADSAGLPHDVATQLVRDDIEIARPLLEHSPVLTDEDLVRIVRTNSLQYALAVAGREQLSETVSDELVDTGQSQVVARLVENAGARLSRPALERVMQDFGAEAEIQDRLVRRPELPFELVERMVGLIGARLEKELVSNQQMPAVEARIVMSAVREKAAISFTAREHGDAKLAQQLRDRLAEGGLGEEELLALLRDGEVASFEIGLGLRARLEPARVRRLLYHPDRRHLAALCIAAGFSMPHYLTLRLALETAESALATRSGAHKAYKPETLRFLQEQYESLRESESRCLAFLDAGSG